MGFCPNQGRHEITAFDNDEPRLWCDDHAELARANAEATRAEGEIDTYDFTVPTDMMEGFLGSIFKPGPTDEGEDDADTI